MYKIVAWSRKRFGFDTAYALQGGFYLGLNQTINIIKGIIIVALIARMLTREEYGLYKYALSFFGIAGVFGLTGITTAVSAAVAKSEYGMIAQGIKKAFAWSGVGACVLGIAGLWFWRTEDTVLAYSLFLSAIIFPLSVPSGFYSAIEVGMKRFSRLCAVNGISSVLIIVSVVLIGKIGPTIPGLVFATLGVPVLVQLAFTWYVVRTLRFLKKEKDTQNMRYGYHQSAIDALGSVASYFDVLAIPNILGPAALAQYSIANTIPGQSKSLGKIAGSLIFPKLSQHDPAFSWHMLKKFLWKFVILGTILGALLALITPFLIGIVFSHAYDDVIPYAQMITVAMGISLPSIFIHNYFQSQLMHRPLYQLNVIYIAVRIISFSILTPLYGVGGAACAESLYRVVGMIASAGAFYAYRPKYNK